MTNLHRICTRSPQTWRVSLGMGAVMASLLLSACSEPEVILPGVRENVRSVIENSDGFEAPADLPVPENTSRAISLPAMTNNASWTQAAGTPSTRINHAALSTAPQLAWSANIGKGDSRKQRITAAPVVAGGKIYTIDSSALVTATSASGTPLWSRDLTPPSDGQGDATGGGLAVDGDTLYVSLGFGTVTALDAATGATRWEQDIEATGSGAPTVYGDMVYFTSGDDMGWALNKNNGRVQWQTGSSTVVGNILTTPAPAISPEIAVMAFGSGEVQGLFRSGGLNRWNVSVLGKRPGRALSNVSDISSGPVISGNTVYVGNMSGRLAAVTLSGGERQWTANEGVVGAVWPAGDSVFGVTDLNELVRFDASTGQRVWGVKLPNFVKEKPKRQSEIVTHHGPILAGGRIILASNDGVLRSFDPTNGALIGTAEIPGGATTAPVVAGGTLYVVSSKGQLHAFR
ncbi:MULTISPECIES: PQQ-like beta-propeller repeat protein [unclassified Sulfitobacter]|jgi:outer membrane protein assembly factor BamB|uniref:PQQ-like beta-propeller repeat protein n=1 Tax=unclassified Sulfitobacter TaxID=196795 RepID=UPI0020CC64D3|nr:PQQ-like beta-propeller repeat protein [Sulfitobacter sp. HGT1]